MTGTRPVPVVATRTIAEPPGRAPDWLAAVVREVVPPADGTAPGRLGAYLLAAAEEPELLAVTVWGGREALAALPTPPGQATYDVVVSRPEPAFVGVPTRAPAPERVARVVTLEGGQVGEPPVVRALSTYAATFTADSPGCVSTLFAADPHRPGILALSVWNGRDAEARTAATNAPLMDSVMALTQAAAWSTRVYDVVACDPVRTPYDGR